MEWLLLELFSTHSILMNSGITGQITEGSLSCPIIGVPYIHPYWRISSLNHPMFTRMPLSWSNKVYAIWCFSTHIQLCDTRIQLLILTPWPGRSPDLNPCNIRVWGFLKIFIYLNPLTFLSDLKWSISRYVRIYREINFNKPLNVLCKNSRL